jgi:hypothetical protein
VNAWKIVLATLVIFVAGIITGASLVRFAERGPKPWRRFTENVAAHPPVAPNLPASPDDPRAAKLPPGNPPLLNREFVLGLARHLRLDSEQREKIDRIIAEGQERIRGLRSEIEPQIHKQMQSTKEQLQAVLTPEQLEQFDRLMKQRIPRRNESPLPPERERRLRDQRNPPPPPPGEPRDTLSGPPHEPPPPPPEP